MSIVAEAPIPFLIVGLALLMAWLEGGFAANVWGPIAFVVLCLAAIATAAGVANASDRSQRVMLAFGVAFCVWSFLSISWADFRGDALISADKTLLYVSVFSLCAFTRTDRAREAILCYGFGTAAIAGFVLLRVAVSDQPRSYFVGDRLLPPVGYENANVCLWMIGVGSLLYAGSSRSGGPVLRAASVGSMALLLDMAVLGQSRAWFYLLPIAVIAAVLLSKERWHTAIALVLAGSAAAAGAPAFAAVYREHVSGSSVHHAAAIGVGVAVAAGIAGALWAILERRLQAPTRNVRLAVVALFVLAVIVGGSLAVSTHPRLRHPDSLVKKSWRDFKVPYEATNQRQDRFLVSLSSDRWRIWTVAWDAFLAHPVVGIGGDNFEERYLRVRPDPLFDPKFPHSTPLRLLSQSGLVGTALFVGFAGLATLRGVRRRSHNDSGGVAAATGLLVAGYWLAHGSLDWFWEIPALSVPAFAFLGFAAGSPVIVTARRASALRWTAVAIVVASIVLVFPPWAEQYLIDQAETNLTHSPSRSDSELRRASSLNPLSADALLVRASIAINIGHYGEAAGALRQAVKREPDGWYAYLQLATLQVQERKFAKAAQSVARARDLNPKDPVAALAQRLIARRQSFPPSFLNGLYVKQTEARFGTG
jgi:hypothetical protein